MATLDFFYVINHPTVQGMYLNKLYRVNANKIIKQNRNYYGSLFDYNIHKALLLKSKREAETILNFLSRYKPFSELQFNCKVSTIAYSPLKTMSIVDIALEEIKENKVVYYNHQTLKNQAIDYLKHHKKDAAYSDVIAKNIVNLEKFIKIVNIFEAKGTITLPEIDNIINDSSDTQSS